MTGVVSLDTAPEVAPVCAPVCASVCASVAATDAVPVASTNVAPVAESVPAAPSETSETVRLAALAISKWEKADRPRERLLSSGAEKLADAELLALFLRTGVPGRTAVDVARALLRRFGSLRAMLDASAAELQAERGIGEARAATLIAVSELCRRMLAEKARNRMLLNSPAPSKTFCA